MVDRIPEAPSPEAVRGTVVHAVLERLFDLPAQERTLDRATAMVDSAWSQVRERDPRAAELDDTVSAAAGGAAAADGSRGADHPGLPSWLGSAGQLLATYFGLEDPARVEPAERELRVSTELDDGLVLRGFIDRLDIAPDGAMRIVDYKTGRAPGEGWEARALFQMRFYALVLWRLRGTMPRLLQLMYLGSGEVVRYAPDEQDLRATERKLRALWAAIESAMRRQDFRPSPSRLCDWCDHKARCPSWGGVLPAYPEPDVEPEPDPGSGPEPGSQALPGSGSAGEQRPG